MFRKLNFRYVPPRWQVSGLFTNKSTISASDQNSKLLLIKQRTKKLR